LRRLTATAVLLVAALLPACGGSGAAAPDSPTSAALPTAAPTPTPVPGPPNVVLIVADDLGWGDLGSYGNTRIKTPNIDRLATEGARYTAFYVPTPVCAAARAGLLTGRLPGRVGIPWNPPNHLNRGEVVLASVLHDRGYATGAVGKWHLGWTAEEMPIHYGFDFYYGIPAGEDEADFILGDQPTRDTVAPDQLARRYTDVAIQFIRSVPADRRFFLYLAHRDPHLDNYPSPEWAGRSGVGPYGDVVEQLDATVGDLLQALHDLELERSTLVIFISDNGPVVPPGSAGPFSGGKFSCEEGGVRVPALMRWPGYIKPGRVVNEVVSALDLFPSLVTITGAQLPARPMDGQDVSRLITGEVERIGGQGEDGGREVIFSASNGYVGLRSGKWKYLRPGIWSSQTTLFDLEADPGEKVNLTRVRPDLAERLEARLDWLTR